MEKSERWTDKLKCDVLRIAYDYAERRGDVWCNGGPDMIATTKLFEGIDPKVERILSYDNGKPDARHMKRDGDWVCL